MSVFFNSSEFDDPVTSFEDMTAAELEEVLAVWPNTDPLAIAHSPGQPKSPSPSSQLLGSLSPEDGNVEYTPTSSNLPDWGNDVDFTLQYDGLGTSPMFATSTTDESDAISPIDSRSSVNSSMSRPPHSSSHGVSSARRSRDSSPASHITNTVAQWAPMAANMTMPGHLSGTAQAPSNDAFDDAAVNTTESFNESLLSDMAFTYHTTMPLRPAYMQPSWGDFDMSQPFQPFNNGSPLAQQLASFPPAAQEAQYLAPHSTLPQHTAQTQEMPQPRRNIHNVRSVQHTRLPHYPSQLRATGPAAQPIEMRSRQAPPTVPTLPSTTLVSTQPAPSPSAYAYSTQLRYAQPSISIDTSAGASRSTQKPIALTHIRSARGTAQPQSPEDTKGKGGRKKGGHLNAANKQRVAKMRKTGACWRCAMQRDPVGPSRSTITTKPPLTYSSVMAAIRVIDASKAPASLGASSSLSLIHI